MDSLLRKNMTFSEREVAKSLVERLPEGGRVVVSHVVDGSGISRSVAVNVIKKLSLAGIIQAESMGSRGTFIRVLDRDSWRSLAS